MRIAIFGDTHGNRFALEAVLKDIEQHTPDLKANLGDGVFGGADPRGAYDLQQALKVPTVRGNTDERLGTPLDEVTEKKAYLEWLHALLPEGAGKRLGELPTVVSLLDREVLLGHGNLESPWEALLLDGKHWASNEQVLERTAEHRDARVVVVGHTHLEHLRQIGGQTFVNAGSVSRPKDGNPAAKWVLLEKQAGLWSVTFKRVNYDVEAAASWARMHAPKGEEEAQQLLTGKPVKKK